MGRFCKSIGKTRMVILSKLTQLLIGLHENKEVLNLSEVAGPGYLVTNLENAASLAHVH